MMILMKRIGECLVSSFYLLNDIFPFSFRHSRVIVPNVPPTTKTVTDTKTASPLPTTTEKKTPKNPPGLSVKPPSSTPPPTSQTPSYATAVKAPSPTKKSVSPKKEMSSVAPTASPDKGKDASVPAPPIVPPSVAPAPTTTEDKTATPDTKIEPTSAQAKPPSKLNPNAKEFKLNAAAKEYTPSGVPGAAMAPVPVPMYGMYPPHMVYGAVPYGYGYEPEMYGGSVMMGEYGGAAVPAYMMYPPMPAPPPGQHYVNKPKYGGGKPHDGRY